MDLKLVRDERAPDSTSGSLYVDGKFDCYTLEDEIRIKKVPGETAIPEGRYRITLRTVGGFHAKYAKLFPDIHRGMLWIRDVVTKTMAFEFILVHMGNTTKDTAGCVLVGTQRVKNAKGEWELRNSKLAYRRLYSRVVGALLRGEEVWITVVTEGGY